MCAVWTGGPSISHAGKPSIPEPERWQIITFLRGVASRDDSRNWGRNPQLQVGIAGSISPCLETHVPRGAEVPPGGL